jgi:sensor histidine kinase YesM
MTDILLGFILFFIILTDVLIYQIAMNQVGMNKWNIDFLNQIRRGQYDFFNVMERKIDRLDANQQRLNVMVKEIKGEKNDGERKNNC